MVKSSFQQAMEQEITGLVEPVIQEADYDLVELQLVQRKSGHLLRILVDRLGGITLDECAELSKRISYVLEVEDPIEKRYTLEVSSPGLDRPLATEADFRRKAGEQIRLTFKMDEKNAQAEGEIIAVEGDQLVLGTDSGEKRFALADIIKGKILY
jgi:ribosome maturation factor RimP